MIAASFVRKASDVTEIRTYTAELMRELYPNSSSSGSSRPLPPLPQVIA